MVTRRAGEKDVIFFIATAVPDSPDERRWFGGRGTHVKIVPGGRIRLPNGEVRGGNNDCSCLSLSFTFSILLGAFSDVDEQSIATGAVNWGRIKMGR